MNKRLLTLLLNMRIQRYVLLLSLTISYIVFFMSSNRQFIVLVYYAHFLTLVPNNFYILLSAMQINELLPAVPQWILRIEERVTANTIALSYVLKRAVFLVVIFGVAAIVAPEIPLEHQHFAVVLTVVHVLSYICQDYMLWMSWKTTKGSTAFSLFIVAAILINLGVHYGIVHMLFTY